MFGQDIETYSTLADLMAFLNSVTSGESNYITFT